MTIAALLLFIRTLGLTLPLWIVAGWSAAEAAIFFIVADVPISWIAVRSGTRAAMLAALVAAVASVVGAALLWLWFGKAPLVATATMTMLPGIDAGTLQTAADVYAGGYIDVLRASFQGIPFKLFVIQAAERHDWLILLLAPLLRLPRFLAIALFVGGISHFLKARMDVRERLALLALLWLVFYGWYFSVMPR